MQQPSYDWVQGVFISGELLRECSKLYSSHYGIWSESTSDGLSGRVKLSEERLRKWVASSDAIIATARLQKQLIGYAISIRSNHPKYGVISWITQLVVHESYRQNNVGKTLLYSTFQFSNDAAWGILSSNPYAIRALEKATRRRCVPERIKQKKTILRNFGKKHVSYMDENSEIVIDDLKSVVFTNFFADHSGIPEKILNVTSDETKWLLGELEEGWEWFAFTFNDQEQLKLSAAEIREMISASDDITKKAYSRMLTEHKHVWEQSGHAWSNHTQSEADFIIKYCNLNSKTTVIDIGCGIGRHSIALAKSGIKVTGIDYAEEQIKIANKEAEEQNLHSVQFIVGDAREKVSIETYDAAICVYDVVGSFVEQVENIKILDTIYSLLKKGGTALISVMNYTLTSHQAKHFFTLEGEPNKLLELNPSRIMEKTGNIFNPDFYMIDTKTRIIYRKEQFFKRSNLPSELLVRDRRYTQEEIEKMCTDVGFQVSFSRHVQAGKWDEDLSSTHSGAKEILILCKKA